MVCLPHFPDDGSDKSRPGLTLLSGNRIGHGTLSLYIVYPVWIVQYNILRIDALKMSYRP
jgi:hypothetical protein